FVLSTKMENKISGEITDDGGSPVDEKEQIEGVETDIGSLVEISGEITDGGGSPVHEKEQIEGAETDIGSSSEAFGISFPRLNTIVNSVEANADIKSRQRKEFDNRFFENYEDVSVQRTMIHVLSFLAPIVFFFL
ncbi:hypothetical protein A2U01_0009078, partial [Trifolium medium]|nr:hypothetical protein [Trifolium medium]